MFLLYDLFLKHIIRMCDNTSGLSNVIKYAGPAREI